MNAPKNGREEDADFLEIQKKDRAAIFRALGESAPAQIAPPLPPLPAPQGGVVFRFMRAAVQNAATAERLPNESSLPHAAARYLRVMRAPPKIVCTAEWGGLDWKSAGIAAECRAPKAEDAAGLTGVVAAAADCGAMLVRGKNRLQLSASLLPRLHIAAVRAADIAPNLAEMLAAPKSRPPGIIALFCGPSRTADIEQTLIMGMHGPLAVHVLVI